MEHSLSLVRQATRPRGRGRRRSAQPLPGVYPLLLAAALGFVAGRSDPATLERWWSDAREAAAGFAPALPRIVPEMASDGSGTGTRVQFGRCHSGGGTNCVVDGDTFWMDGDKVRIADIDTPETHPPRCAAEARAGEAATARLRELLNAGPVTLVTTGRATDRYGRKLRIVERNGVSLGETLVAEGLARPWEGRRRGWCGAA